MTDARAVVEGLTRRGLTVATAESLTAGLLAATLANVPGASAVLRGGLVVYATDLKASLAGVSQETLEAHGAVSADTAAALACGARLRCGADVGVGLTGVAGPSEQEGHPVGTVFVGVDGPGTTRRVVALTGVPGDGGSADVRSRVRSGAVDAALTALVEVLGERAAPGAGNEPGPTGVVRGDA